MKAAAALFVVVLLAADAAHAQGGKEEEEEEEEAVLAGLKVCSETVKPSEDDLNEIAKGELKSDAAKAVITCWFKESQVLQGRTMKKDKTITFFRAITPGDPKNDNVTLMKKLVDKCEAKVASPLKDAASETDAAGMIYNCLVQEGRAMRLTFEEGNGSANTTNSR